MEGSLRHAERGVGASRISHNHEPRPTTGYIDTAHYETLQDVMMNHMNICRMYCIVAMG